MRGCGEAALHARCALGRDDALLGSDVELALGGQEKRLGVLTAGLGCGARLLHGGAERALDRAVAVGALLALTVALLGGCVIGHLSFLLLLRGLLGVRSLDVPFLVDREGGRAVGAG